MLSALSSCPLPARSDCCKALWQSNLAIQQQDCFRTPSQNTVMMPRAQCFVHLLLIKMTVFDHEVRTKQSCKTANPGCTDKVMGRFSEDDPNCLRQRHQRSLSHARHGHRQARLLRVDAPPQSSQHWHPSGPGASPFGPSRHRGDNGIAPMSLRKPAAELTLQLTCAGLG